MEDVQDARARVSEYFKRDRGLSDAEADRRAEEVVGLIGWPTRLFTGAIALVDNWWLFLLRGLLAILFGVLTLVQPAAALVALVLVFGVWALIDGVTALVLAVSGWRSWQLVLAGLVGVAAGIFTFYRPDITALGLYAAVAAWSIARGIFEIAVAIELRKEIQGEVWYILGGVASICFGVLLIALPAAGVLAVAWLIGVYALVFGAIMIALSFRLHQVKSLRRPRVVTATGTPAPQAS